MNLATSSGKLFSGMCDGIRVGFVVFALTLIPLQSGWSYHYPWDQGHDTTDYPDPNDPGPCDGPNCDPCKKGTGSPVFIATGHFIWSETDLSIAGRPGISLTRTYNSNDPRAGIFGNGWSSDCDLHLTKTSTSTVADDGSAEKSESLILTASNGKRYEFKKASSGTYLAPSGRSDKVDFSTSDDGDSLITLTSQSGYSHTFNDKSQLTRRVEPNGNVVNYSYNDTGQLSGLSDDAGRSIDLLYDAQGLVTSVTDHTGRQWVYGYDTDGNLTQVTDPLGGNTQYEYETYNPIGDAQAYYQLTKITDATGVIVSQIAYKDDRVTSYTAGSNRFDYQYDLSNRSVTKSDNLSSTWVYEYNEEQVITTKADPLGNVESYKYDSDGNLVNYVDALGKVWSSTFDDQRRKLTHTTPLGHVSQFEYDTDFRWPERSISALGRTTSTVYDAQGNAVQVTNAVGDVVKMGYDGNGNLVQLDDALGNRSNLTYNSFGLVATNTDPNGRTTQFTYDTLGRVTTLTSGSGQVLTTAYDALDRVASITDPSGNVTDYTYDASGRTLSHTDPAGKATLYTYDAHGRLQTRTYPDGRVIQYQYRLDNLNDQITRADGSVVRYGYDASKLVTSVDTAGDVTTYSYTARYELSSASNSAATIGYTYDDDGRLINEDFNGTTLTYAYNADNERSSFSYDGRTLDYARDGLGRITSITTPEGIYGFTYDANGNRTATTLPNGSQVAYTYDASEQLTDLTHSGVLNASYQYQYDQSGILTQISGAENWSYGYDADSQLVSAVGDGGTDTYSYDAAGNLTNNGRQYDDNHRLTQSNDWTISYDSLGNVTEKAHTDGSKVAYTWNSLSQLIQVDRFGPGATTADSSSSFTYGPMGRRLSKTVNGSETQFLYDGSDRIGNLDNSGSLVGYYTFGPSVDEPLGSSFGASQSYFHADHLGSIVALSDDSVVTDQYQYDPWGQSLSVSGSTENDFRYTAREYEADDLYYYRARYYDPTLQRFLSEDPLGFAGGDHNLYRYVGNNPANFTDPSGNWAFLIPLVWVGIETALAVYDVYNLYQTLSDPCIGTWDKVLDAGLFAAGALLPGGGYTKADDAARYADDVADAVRRSPCGCFDGDTEVLTDTGYTEISDIEVGDLVSAKNEKTGDVSFKPVTRLFQYDQRSFYKLAVRSSTEKLETIDVTDDHPFWVAGIGWVLSGELRPGQKIEDVDGGAHVVESLRPTGVVTRSYTFEVADYHTYFVSSSNLWVHNCPKARPWDRKPTRSQARQEASENGWREVRDPPTGNTHGQPVFTDGKNYYSADVDGHSGGTWKKFNRSGNRTGTLDRTLDRIGD